MTPSKSFSLEELSKVLCYQNLKYSHMYNIYFYGFEKESKSQYYMANRVEGCYFNYRFPFNSNLVSTVLPKVLNTPLSSDTLSNGIREKTQSELTNKSKTKRTLRSK